MVVFILAFFLPQFGSVGQPGIDAVDQPPQCDVDPARRLLPLEVQDVVRGLGDDVTRQTEGAENPSSAVKAFTSARVHWYAASSRTST